MNPLPESVRIKAEPQLAESLAKAAEDLPTYESKDLYAFELQAEIHDRIRQAAPDGFDSLVGQIRETLSRPPFTTLVQNLQFDQNHGVFVALNRALGNLVSGPYKPPRAQLVHYIQPSTDIPSSRGTVTESERLHTDSADWPDPVELVTMVCIRPDSAGGGWSKILTSEGFRQDVAAKFSEEAIRRLETEAVPWQMADHHEEEVIWQSVLDGEWLRWRRYTIDAALDAHADVSLPKDLIELLDEIDDFVAKSPSMFQFLMEAGDFLLADNHRTLHARTPLKGDYQTSGRLMIRSWVSQENDA